MTAAARRMRPTTVAMLDAEAPWEAESEACWRARCSDSVIGGSAMGTSRRWVGWRECAAPLRMLDDQLCSVNTPRPRSRISCVSAPGLWLDAPIMSGGPGLGGDRGA